MHTVLRDGLPCFVYRPTLDQCPRLDIREWTRDCMLIASSPLADQVTFTVTARSADHKAVLLVGVVVRGDTVDLQYNGSNRASERPNRSVTTTFVTSATRFGGSRVWLSCPSCDRRAAVFYVVSGHLICARCARKRRPYASETATVSERWHRVARKCRARIRASAVQPLESIKRPKNMRRVMFERIRSHIQLCEGQALLLEYRNAFGRCGWYRSR
jgi:hypothetical protein